VVNQLPDRLRSLATVPRVTSTRPAAGTGERALPRGPSALPAGESAGPEITRHLLDYLLSGDVSPGERLPPERRLAEMLGVGRGAVRETIKSLSLLGLLDVRRGDGTYLSSSSSQLLPRVIEWGLLLGDHPIRDLMEARNHLEVDAAGLAAERSEPAAVLRIRACIEDMRAATDVSTYVDADIAFHVAVAQASQNAVFANLLRSIQALLRDWARRALELDRELDVALAMHLPIVDAIGDGDAEAARAAMVAHNARWQLRVSRVLGVDPAVRG
jgi:GntR family transcriptional repressor for pyruvate dehydrogenase complex